MEYTGELTKKKLSDLRGILELLAAELGNPNAKLLEKEGAKGTEREGPLQRPQALQIQAGPSALKDAMEAGFEDFKRIRIDPGLENIRKSEEFEPLMKKYDESFINENAIYAIKSLFGINKK